MVKLLLIFVSVTLAVTFVSAQTKNCPLASKMTNCSPKCKDDTECFGQTCCPNICNSKSCTAANQRTQATGYKENKSGGAGSYCGNVKCNSYEKCDLDRNTKRYRCIRT